ncbi:histidine phosphatase family protein [Massilia sp. TS11]|uniref:histidine phosphatase family protein n=1 Tax=Massilia sp. TS11 TaxID=2908003 RepID=UPI001EDAB4DF|nr:histidine phosphatase family protein [Massilia sp. TS11]MCG2585062.1 histidine phosphatase family protein [Massilia sp. TS11]
MKIWSALLLAAWLLPARAEPLQERLAGPELLQQLRAGGLVLYLRHGLTDNSRADRTPRVDLNDCGTQRVLNAAGRQMAAEIGAALRSARVPVGEIIAGPLCRTRDTANLAFPGAAVRVEPLLMYTANLTAAEKQPILRATRALLTQPVAPGTNRVLVAHGPNMMDLTGYFPTEGTLVVFQPDGGAALRYLGSVPPTLWPQLLR